MIHVKICGITTHEDADLALKMGADSVGFVIGAESPRRISPRRCAKIVKRLKGAAAVGVFMNLPAAEVLERARTAGVRIVQLHGDETAGEVEFLRRNGLAVWKAFLAESADLCRRIAKSGERIFIVDSPVRGKLCDLTLAREACRLGSGILAGGLRPENVRNALEIVHPYGVDVSSGVERSPGLKDAGKIGEFIEEVRQWESRTGRDTSADSAGVLSRKR